LCCVAILSFGFVSQAKFNNKINPKFKRIVSGFKVDALENDLPNVKDIGSDIPNSCPKKTFFSVGQIPISCILQIKTKVG